MHYLPTAFANLAFAWKLLVYGEAGNIDLEKLDTSVRFQDEDGKPFFNLPAKIFDDPNDLLNILQNNLTIAFGVAAITLNRSLEESGHQKPDTIDTEEEQCIALIYQVRNAFAHDIAEPTWVLRNKIFQRRYTISGHTFDLTDRDQKPFSYEDFGIEHLYYLKDFAEEHLLRK